MYIVLSGDDGKCLVMLSGVAQRDLNLSQVAHCCGLASALVDKVRNVIAHT